MNRERASDVVIADMDDASVVECHEEEESDDRELDRRSVESASGRSIRASVSETGAQASEKPP